MIPKREPKWIPIKPKHVCLLQLSPPKQSMNLEASRPHVFTPDKGSKPIQKEIAFLSRLGPKERDKLAALIRDLAIAQEKECELNSLVVSLQTDLDMKLKMVEELQEENVTIQKSKSKMESQLLEAQIRLHEYEKEIESLKSKIKKVKTHSVAVETLDTNLQPSTMERASSPMKPTNPKVNVSDSQSLDTSHSWTVKDKKTNQILRNWMHSALDESSRFLEPDDIQRFLSVSKKNELNLSLLMHDDTSSSSVEDHRPKTKKEVIPLRTQTTCADTITIKRDAETTTKDMVTSPIKKTKQMQTLNDSESHKRDHSIQTSFIAKENCILCEPSMRKSTLRTVTSQCPLCHDKNQTHTASARNETLPELTQSFATHSSSDKSCLFLNETSMMKSLAEIVLEMDTKLHSVSESQKETNGPIDKLNDIIHLLNFV